mmetsp:Transcript_9706/g.19057  ORF Transcript_9706/g.19057 Transcript_9706/m.19057 type:complete len:299 (-) Transcript_9706:14-910(-)
MAGTGLLLRSMHVIQTKLILDLFHPREELLNLLRLFCHVKGDLRLSKTIILTIVAITAVSVALILHDAVAIVCAIGARGVSVNLRGVGVVFNKLLGPRGNLIRSGSDALSLFRPVTVWQLGCAPWRPADVADAAVDEAERHRSELIRVNTVVSVVSLKPALTLAEVNVVALARLDPVAFNSHEALDEESTRVLYALTQNYTAALVNACADRELIHKHNILPIARKIVLAQSLLVRVRVDGGLHGDATSEAVVHKIVAHGDRYREHGQERAKSASGSSQARTAARAHRKATGRPNLRRL